MSLNVRNNYLFLLIIVFSQFLTSCLYETDEVFENRVNEAVDPQLEVVELDFADDTVYTYGLSEVKFHFKSNSNRIHGVRMLIDNVAVQTLEGENGFFDFKALKLTDGIHKLVVEVHTATNTGSIADKLNAESLVLSKEFVLIADASRKRDIGYTIDNGFFKLQWEAYKGSDIVNYKVISNIYGSSEVLLGNSYKTSFIDSSYVGQERTYYVKVIKKNGTELLWAGYNVKPNGLPELSVVTTNNNEHILHWTKGKCYNAIRKIKVFINFNDPIEYSPNDSIHKLNLLFTEPIKVKLEIMPLKQTVLGNHTIEQNTYGGIQSVLHAYSYELNTSQVSSDVFAYFFADTVFYYSTSANKFSKKICVDTGDKSTRSGHKLSPLAKYILYNIAFNQYTAVDLTTLDRFKIDNMQAYAGQAIGSLTISDVGTGYIPNLNKNNVLFDFRSLKAIKYHYLPSNSMHYVRISSDGNYVAINGVDSMRLIQLNVPGSVYPKQVWSRTAGNYYYSDMEFSSANSNQFLHWSDNKMTIYQLSPLAQLKQFEMTERLINVDFFHNQFLTYLDSSLHVRSLMDGSLNETIAVRSGNFNLYKLYNRKIYYSNRYIYNLK